MYTPFFNLTSVITTAASTTVTAEATDDDATTTSSDEWKNHNKTSSGIGGKQWALIDNTNEL